MLLENAVHGMENVEVKNIITEVVDVHVQSALL